MYNYKQKTSLFLPDLCSYTFIAYTIFVWPLFWGPAFDVDSPSPSNLRLPLDSLESKA